MADRARHSPWGAAGDGRTTFHSSRAGRAGERRPPLRTSSGDATRHGMNATATQLDTFLAKADPATARTVEQIVHGLISVRSRRGERAADEGTGYRLPARHLGVAPGIDLTKLAHVDDEGA